jgi:hypothetical protein
LPSARAVEDVNDVEPLTCLWEAPDGTRAWVIELGGSWELRVLRHGRLVAQHRCCSFGDLMAAATTAHRLVAN